MGKLKICIAAALILLAVFAMPVTAARSVGSVTRSLSTTVTPGGILTVTITPSSNVAAGIGYKVIETLPDGVTFVSSDVGTAADVAVTGNVVRTGQVVEFVILGESSFSYTVMAPAAAGTITFSGAFIDGDRNTGTVGGVTTVTVVSNMGSISVTSFPSGAEVLVDGVPEGIASPTLTVHDITPGSHTVKCKLSGYSDDEKTVTVAASSITTVTCSQSRLPLLSVSPDPYFNLGTISAGASASRTFSISNAGDGFLTWSISSDQPWITINPTGGTNSGTVTININTAGLSPDSYSGTITVNSNGGTRKGSVSLNLIPPTTSVPVTTTPVTPPAPQLTTQTSNGSIFDKEVIIASIGAIVTIITAYFAYKKK